MLAHARHSQIVVEAGSTYPDVVWPQDDAVASKVVVRSCCQDVCLELVDEHITLKVDELERTINARPSRGSSLQIAEDSARIFTKEGEVYVACLDVQVQSVVHSFARNDGATHLCPVLRQRSSHVSLQYDGSFLLAPIAVEVHVSEVGSVEGEVFYLQESVSKRLLHERCGIDAARHSSVEIHFVEVDEVHDV